MARIKGIKTVQRAIRRVGDVARKKMERNLVMAGLYILRKSMEIVPVETGNLKASGYCRSYGWVRPHLVVVRVGYTAAYAIYVHEDLELRHGAEYNAWHGEAIAAGLDFARGENQQAKFLEAPIRMHRAEIQKIIRNP